jgi:hypothetical protein
MTLFRVNLGGEGEVPGVLNQQIRQVVEPGWVASRTQQTFSELVQAGHQFLICDNTYLPIPDNSLDEVITNNVPIDITTWMGPGVQSSEIRRILKPGGRWIRDGVVHYTKP